MEEDVLIYATYVPLFEIAKRLGVYEGLLRRWLKDKGYQLTTIKRDGRIMLAVPPGMATIIVAEAKKEGFENPPVKEEEVKQPEPDDSAQRKAAEQAEEAHRSTTLAYRQAHPTYFFEPAPVIRVNAKPSWELGRSGDMQPLPP